MSAGTVVVFGLLLVLTAAGQKSSSASNDAGKWFVGKWYGSEVSPFNEEVAYTLEVKQHGSDLSARIEEHHYTEDGGSFKRSYDLQIVRVGYSAGLGSDYGNPAGRVLLKCKNPGANSTDRNSGSFLSDFTFVAVISHKVPPSSKTTTSGSARKSGQPAGATDAATPLDSINLLHNPWTNGSFWANVVLTLDRGSMDRTVAQFRNTHRKEGGGFWGALATGVSAVAQGVAAAEGNVPVATTTDPDSNPDPQPASQTTPQPTAQPTAQTAQYPGNTPRQQPAPGYPQPNTSAQNTNYPANTGNQTSAPRLPAPAPNNGAAQQNMMASTSCISVVDLGGSVYGLRNNCNQKLEVSFCVQNPKSSLRCDSSNAGGEDTLEPHQGSYDLPSYVEEGRGTVRFGVCISPALPQWVGSPGGEYRCNN